MGAQPGAAGCAEGPGRGLWEHPIGPHVSCHDHPGMPRFPPAPPPPWPEAALKSAGCQVGGRRSKERCCTPMMVLHPYDGAGRRAMRQSVVAGVGKTHAPAGDRAQRRSCGLCRPPCRDAWPGFVLIFVSLFSTLAASSLECLGNHGAAMRSGGVRPPRGMLLQLVNTLAQVVC